MGKNNPATKKEYDRRYYLANKGKIQTQCKAWIKANPEKRRDILRRYKYGTDGLDIWTGVCSICEKLLESPYQRNVHLDHCHTAKKVRGWLCAGCNTAIGKLPSVDLLRKAIEYVEKI